MRHLSRAGTAALVAAATVCTGLNMEATSSAKPRPYEGRGTEIGNSNPGGTDGISYQAGVATHWGAWTAEVTFQLIGVTEVGGVFSIQGVYSTANGDTVNMNGIWEVDVTVIPNVATGHFWFEGGTGRFEHATGEGVWGGTHSELWEDMWSEGTISY